VNNVRIVQADAVAGIRHLVAPGSIDEIWMFFPDPWHKARHHKRRLLTADFVDLVASRTRVGGIWRLATDWEDYAAQMRSVIDRHPAFANEHPGGWAPRWPDRPLTRFERRGLDAGRQVFDLAYRRVA
jgi:tRNA (guanine-N7-)-methyltransferase